LAPDHGSVAGGKSVTTGIHVSAGSLIPGTYTGTIVVTASGTQGAARQIVVTLAVNPAPPVPLQVRASLDRAIAEPGDTVTLTAAVSQGATAIANASVSGLLFAPDGSTQLAAFTSTATSGTYRTTVTLPAATGFGALYISAGTPDGLTATDARQFIVTEHNLTFVGNQLFPGTLKQSATGTVSVNVLNEAYVTEPTSLELVDITSGQPVLLARSDVSVGLRRSQIFTLNFAASVLAEGQHTLQARI